MPYPEIYPPDEGDYHPLAVVRTMFVDAVDLGVAETILERLRASAAEMPVAQLRVLGGAMARAADATAFAHRSSRIMVNVAAVYASPEERPVHEAWVSAAAAALRQGDGGAYANFLGAEARSASDPPIRERPGTASPRSSGGTTRRTSFASTRTSRRARERLEDVA